LLGDTGYAQASQRPLALFQTFYLFAIHSPKLLMGAINKLGV